MAQPMMSAAFLQSPAFKLMLLTAMVLQNSCTVLVGNYTRTAVSKEDLYDVSHLILVTELGKLLLSCGFEYVTSDGKLVESIRANIIDRPLDALKILVPALLYLVQNSLLYTALSNLSAPIFQVTYQAKLVTTAVVSVIMLNRRYSFQQWICLVALSVGVAIVVLGESDKKVDEDKKPASGEQSLFVGLCAVTVACLSSALAGVYFEKVVKGKNSSSPTAQPTKPVSVWMRNVQLAFFTICLGILQGMIKGVKSHGGDEARKSYFHGFTGLVWLLVGLQAGGGLLVAAIIKYADNVLKGLATGVSVCFATTMS